MKILKLFFYDISAFIKNRFNIFIILFVGVAISAFSLNLYYFTAISNLESQYSLDSITREVKIQFDSSVSAQEIDNMMRDSSKPYYSTLYERKFLNEDAYDLSAPRLFNIDGGQENDNIGIVGGAKADNNYQILEGRTFNEQDKKENNVLLNYGIFVVNDENTIKINQETFNVIGRTRQYDFQKCVFMDIDRFISNNYPTRAVILTLKDEPGENILSLIEQDFSELDPNMSFYEPQKINSNAISSFISAVSTALLIVLLALISLISLYRFWLRYNFKTYATYKICGMKNRTLLSVILLEAVVISSVSFLAGTALYFIVYNTINPTEIFHNSRVSEFLILYLVIILFSLIPVIPPLIRTIKKSPLSDL